MLLRCNIIRRCLGLMTRRWDYFVLLLIGALFIAGCSGGDTGGANSGTGGGTLQFGSAQGFIRALSGDGALVTQDVTITIAGSSVTTSTGGYEIKDLPAGNHTLKAQSLGYDDYSTQITIQGGQSIVANVILQSSLAEQVNKDLEPMFQALKHGNHDLMMSVHTSTAEYEIIDGGTLWVLNRDEIRDLWRLRFTDPDYFFDDSASQEKDELLIVADDFIVLKNDSLGGELTLRKEAGKWKIQRMKLVL